MRLVLDASAALKWYAAEEGSEDALRLLQEGNDFVAPDVLALEVAAVLLRKERRGELNPGTASAALLDLDMVGCEFVAHGPLLRRATDLSTRHRLGVLDCLYLVVAHDRGLRVVTYDGGMRQLARSLSIPLWAADDPT
ncbi:type II toxin-antitoxin system VapC family toxin [Falsiroseomonas oryzae]|uniref:type II toxin-antitoxin system VapC family toxin n=1 Tax=Falsiroseomonas oryzae TaxID=2766473 RepID=UPI0022EA13CE|nr:type II toxin-antitoxin system VapC family toxin [Roseomonas sp. MO-31]